MVGIVLGLHAGLVEHRGPHDGLGDRVGVAVGRRPPVLEVAEAVLAHLARDADAGASVGHASGELEDVGGLVVAGEPPGVVPATPRVVDADVVVVPLAQLLDGRFDVSVGDQNGVRFGVGTSRAMGNSQATTYDNVLLKSDVPPAWRVAPTLPRAAQGSPGDSLEAPVPPHLLGAVVGVAAGPVPVARHRFGVQSGHHPEVLADAVQDEASHPEVIAHLDAFARPHLKFPLEEESGCVVGDRGDLCLSCGAACVPVTPHESCQHGEWLSFTIHPSGISNGMGSIELDNRTALAHQKKKWNKLFPTKERKSEGFSQNGSK